MCLGKPGRLDYSKKVGAVFEAWKARPLLHPRYGVFQPESISRLRDCRLDQHFVGRDFEALGFFARVALSGQGHTIFPRARKIGAAISCNLITARTFSGYGSRLKAFRRSSLARNKRAMSAFIPSVVSISRPGHAVAAPRQDSFRRYRFAREKSGPVHDLRASPLHGNCD